MSTRYSVRRAAKANSRWQAFTLLLLGVLCLLVAWLVHPDYHTYPVGVLLLGVGILIAAALNPYRLIIAGLLITLVGIAVFFAFKPIIPVLRGQELATYIFAIGLALLGIALMARRGYIGVGAFSPGLIVILISVLEFLLFAHLTPNGFIPFMLSFWLPGFGLLILGLIYLVGSVRV